MQGVDKEILRKTNILSVIVWITQEKDTSLRYL